MPGRVPSRIHVYRLVHHANVRHMLHHGLCHRGHPDFDPHYVNIGNTDIITKRVAESVGLEGYGDLVEYVPFYFSGKTPMLYNIKTGYGVPQLPQRDLVYIVCCRWWSTRAVTWPTTKTAGRSGLSARCGRHGATAKRCSACRAGWGSGS